MRLGAPFGEPQRYGTSFLMIGRRPYSCRKLASIYDEIINHPSTSDELRRSTEAKLFRYKLKHLKALPVNDRKKAPTLRVVDEMMRGMILLKIPDELVWTQWLESKNAGRIGKLYQPRITQEFSIDLFLRSI